MLFAIYWVVHMPTREGKREGGLNKLREYCSKA